LCSHTFTIMLTTQPQVLEHIIHGDLPYQYHHNPQVESAIDLLTDHTFKDIHPGIYINYQTTEDGTGPTPFHLNQMLRDVRRYLDPAESTFANEVDQHVHCTYLSLVESQKGVRVYLSRWSQADQSWHEVHGRRQILNDFADCLERALASIPDTDWHTHLRTPLSEVGYSDDPCGRIRQHERQTRSNMIMNLLDTICAIFPTLQISRFHGYVVYALPHACLAALAEIFFTRIAHAYTSGGMGCSHALAGRSNSSAELLKSKFWDDFYRWIETHIDPEENSRVLTSRSQAHIRVVREGDQRLHQRLGAFQNMKTMMKVGKEDDEKEDVTEQRRVIDLHKQLLEGLMRQEEGLREMLQ